MRLSKETQIIYEYELSRINEQLDIQIPQACADQQADAESKYPVPPNAVQQAAMGGIYNWVVPNSDDIDSLVEFYETELTALGWEQSGGSNVGVTMMSFTKDGELINLTLTPDGQGGIAILLIEG